MQIEFGLPIISFDITSAKEMIDDGNNGFIVKRYDSNEFVNKMKLNKFNFIVTPKEIDSLIEKITTIVSEGINMSF